MSTAFSPRIGIYGSDAADNQPHKGCGLWPAGHTAAVTAAGGAPASIEMPEPGHPWEETFLGLDGVIFLGRPATNARQAANEERFCQFCRDREIPYLGIDLGLHALNLAFGGTIFTDLPRELPTALQHRHPPEPGVRHAITVTSGTRLAQIYGEGEIVVNSEHYHAVNRVARGFRVSGRALDGVVEALEAETDGWFAVGVQWNPGSTTASGLDIQLYRGLIDACKERNALTISSYQHAA